jgi:hypothetical protein
LGKILIYPFHKCKTETSNDRENVVGRERRVRAVIRHIAFAGAASLFCAGGATAQAVTPEDIFAIGERPTLNFYGAVGGIDTPSGEAMPDGQLAVGISSFGGITRTTLSFQATPRMSFSFRYAGIQDWNSAGFETYRDRSFDFRFLVNRESRFCLL